VLGGRGTTSAVESTQTLVRRLRVADPFAIISRSAVVIVRGGRGACVVVKSPNGTRDRQA
jgi:hypothetical protein